MRHRLWAVVATAVVAVSGATVVGAPPAPAAGGAVAATVGADVVTDQVIVRYTHAGVSADAATLSRVAGLRVTPQRALVAGTYVVKLAKVQRGAALQRTLTRLARVRGVLSVEPDLKMFATATPNDPSYPSQWDLGAATATSYGANLPAAWDVTTGSASVRVAVVDTGYRPHADLAGRFLPGYDFISDTMVANDGNGRDADASDPGDWITSTESRSGYFAGCPVTNSSWHGTHVSGTIGAASNNSVGISGINWVSQIVPVRVLGKCGGYTSDIVDGMRWAAGLPVSGVPANPNPVRVINLSLGGSGACTATWQNAINEITAAGVVVVVAAGNANANAANYSPASCNNVITVAATGKAGSRAYYSNYGTTVEIAAPGGDSRADGSAGTILSTLNAGTTVPGADSYAYYQGTSMATPHVAGVVSLVLSVNEALTPAQVLSVLQASARPFPAGSTCSTTTCGAGILDAAAAVTAAGGTAPPPPPPPPPPAAPGAFGKSSPANGAKNQNWVLSLSWAASTGASSYQYCIDTTNNNACDASWVSVGTNRSVTLVLSSRRTYYWQVRALNTGGTTEANAGAWWSFGTR